MNSRQTSTLWRRRDFLSTAANTTTAITLMGGLATRAEALGQWSSSVRMTGAEDVAHRADQGRMEQLVLRAIDAARSAGARYAEARVTRTVTQYLSTGFGSDIERYTIGVRVLVDGAWGFASSTYWEMDEATALAKDAVSQARINAAVFPRQVDMGTYPVAKGSWVTPIRIDPFQNAIEEKLDFFRSLDGALPRHVPMRRYEWKIEPATLIRQERVTATSEGALFPQTLYKSGGAVSLVVTAIEPGRQAQEVGAAVKGIGLAGAGWELFLDAKIREQVPALAEEAEEMFFLPAKPVDVGRYELVVSASAVARLLEVTLGDATQLDRAVGMEANAGGTSYLGPDPEEYLGTVLGSSLLTVTGNRSQPRGLATVKWDDEGVEPETFPIIHQGTFVDYQTTREQASWLAQWYQSQQRPIRSHGCAVAPEALDFPMQHTPNLQMAPGTGTATFKEMIKNTKKGIAYYGGRISTDFQSRSGGSNLSMMREIVDGKLGPVLLGGDIMFMSSQLWKNVMEIGGASSIEVVGSGALKGQPQQSSLHSIEAAPVRFKEITVVDGTRR